jgi:hypothetical protein
MSRNRSSHRPEQGSLSRQYPGVVENYTQPFLYAFAAWVFCALTVIWAIWGFLLALVISALANHAITLGAARRAARAVRPPTAPPPQR